MIRDEDGQLNGYVYIDLNSTNYGGFVDEATRKLQSPVEISGSYGYKWCGEYEFELRGKQQLKLILPIVFFMIFLLISMVCHCVAETVVLIVPTIYAMTGGLLLQRLLGYNFRVAVWEG
jgi:Cu(I)/Ag(I) efflux system membrane protein CusA/SilA